MAKKLLVSKEIQTQSSSVIIDTRATQTDIEHRIYTFRGVQVMVDRDLAELYGVETRRINEQVKRHQDRFPERFMFQLNDEEFSNWKSQIATSDWTSQTATSNYIKMGIRRAPYVFTEQGVAMLATVLNSREAARISIRIMDAFVAMRRFIATNAQVFQRLDRIELTQLHESEERKQLETRFDNLLARLDDGSVKPIEGVFVEGQVLDARIYIEQLIGSAKKEVILIDGYIDARTFDILEARKMGVKATIYTEVVGRKLLAEAKAHDVEYPNRSIELKEYNNRFHDRFLIVDDDLYHFGASFNELGKRLFAFDKMGINKQVILSQL